MNYPFKNLVFEGGGVKGIAYVGAMKILEEKKIMSSITRVGGTSAGAINALLVGLGYSAQDTRDILFNFDFNRFMDDSWFIFRDILRLIRLFGWNRGDVLRKWFGELIERKTGNPESTFADIQSLKKQHNFRDMYFVGTNVSTQTLSIFSYDHTPDMPVAEAVRISMSIPLYFAARKLNGQVYVDGGVLSNYPVKLFDRRSYVSKFSHDKSYYAQDNKGPHGKKNPYVYNCETLGFRLDSNRQIKFFTEGVVPQVNPIKNVISFLKNLMTILLNTQDTQHLHGDDWQRTIYIDSLGVGATDFSLPAEKKEALIEAGIQGARSYFEWYDDLENRVDKS